MSKLFEGAEINGMAVRNRFVRSATYEGMARGDGSASPSLVGLMAELARGGVGLIITGHAYTEPQGRVRPYQMGINGDELLPGLREMAEAVHKEQGRIAVQLSHGGCQAVGVSPAETPCGPSSLEGDIRGACREAGPEEISRIVESFGAAAARAREAGFDGVQVHAAHGYLLSQFLSPFFNRREDEYGGSLANRARMLLEVCRAVRGSVGRGFPLIVKINSEDFVARGLTVDEMVQVASWLESAGVDAIELSGGMAYSGERSHLRKIALKRREDVFYLDAARRYKEKVRIPLMLVGGIRSLETAEQLVERGVADYISLCRPLICEPHLINRWKSGDRRMSACVSDNLCHVLVRRGEPLRCARNKDELEQG